MAIRAWLKFMAVALFATAITPASAAAAITTWENPGTGASAGDWFEPNNWNPTMVPGAADDAEVNNGGEAKANIGGPISVNSIAVGENGSTGLFTSDFVNISTVTGIDIGRVDTSAATGSEPRSFVMRLVLKRLQAISTLVKQTPNRQRKRRRPEC